MISSLELEFGIDPWFYEKSKNQSCDETYAYDKIRR